MPVKKPSKKTATKSRSWFQQTQKGQWRNVAANEIKHHRAIHNSAYGYARERNYANLKKQYKFDLENNIRKRLPKEGKLYLLDSGAGFLGVSADTKMIFGNKVFVTAVNVASPTLSKTTEKKTACTN